MGSKGTETKTVQSGPPPEVMSAYRDLISRAQGVASTPYQQYNGQMQAGFTPAQTAAFGTIDQSQGISMPYINQAADYARQGAAPISSASIQNYLNPYQSSVIDATMGNIERNNALQQNQVVGNSVAQGAFGGDRNILAQTELARNQALANNQIFAQLNAGNYSQALAAAQGDAARAGQAAYTFGNLGQQAQASTLTGAQAQLAAGNQQQQQAQAGLNIPYQQWLQKQAFPYQQTGWLAGVETGVGSNMGGTSTGTSPAPNPWNQVLGVGMQVAGAFLKDGGAVNGYAEGGAPSGLSMPYADAQSFIPVLPIAHGSGPPQISGSGGDQQSGANKMAADAEKLADKMKNAWDSPGKPIDITPPGAGFAPDAVGSISPFGTMPAMSPLGPLYARGGHVRGYADGGFPSFDDRFAGDPMSQGISLPFGDFADRFPEAGTFVASNGLADNRMGLVEHGRASPFLPPDVIPVPRARPAGAPMPPAEEDYPALFDDMNRTGVPSSALGFQAAARRPAGPSAADIDDPNSAYNQGLAGAPAPVSGGIGVPMAPAAALPMAPASMPAAAEAQKRSGFNLGILPDNLRMPLIAAGLGMMASRSPYLGVAFGEGGLHGLQTYQATQKQEIEQAQKERQFGIQQTHVENEAKRLAQQAEHSAKQLELQTKTQAEMADYRRSLMERENLKPTGSVTAEGHPILYDTRKPGVSIDAITGESIKGTEAVKSAKDTGANLTPDALELGARQIAAGDLSPLTNLGHGAQRDARIIAYRNRAAEILVDENGLTPAEAAIHLSGQIQAFKARQIGLGAEARTGGTREANLSIILRAADAAIPAALEASEKLGRTGFVPLNKIIQKGQVMTSDPELKEFGMANLQLAEHWARAMNPTGVMRESDRDKALEFLSTADSPDTYRRAVQQLYKQIQREKAAVDAGRQPVPGTPATPGGKSPSEAKGAPSASESRPTASTKAEYEALPSGTEFIGSDGKPYRKP